MTIQRTMKDLVDGHNFRISPEETLLPVKHGQVSRRFTQDVSLYEYTCQVKTPSAGAVCHSAELMGRHD